MAKQAHHDGCGEPIKPVQDRQCCSGCPLSFALVPSESNIRIFYGPDRERFALENFSLKSRTDRPPVPPPRASLAA